MAEHELGADARGPLEELELGGHAGGHLAHLLGARHLEPVRPEIIEGAGVEKRIEAG